MKEKNSNGPLRFPIIEKTKQDGYVYAHGRIEQGQIKIGDKLVISPTGYQTQVGAILDHQNQSVMYARPGENVLVKLINIEDENMVNKGDVIIARDSSMPVTVHFEADIKLFELLENH